MKKLNRIVELLDGKGQILIRNTMEHENGNWFVNCFLEEITKLPLDTEPSHSKYTSKITETIHQEWAINLEATLDEIIKKLEDMKNEKES